jgi:DNA-directed RNA polymerase subunit RPC12/RpoP
VESPYREVTKEDWKKVLAYLSLTMLMIVGSAFALASELWPAGITVWLLVPVVGGGLFLLVRWHARVTAYRCGNCGNEFEISTLADFLSPHLPQKKFLKCPGCGHRSWATVLMKR